VPAYAIPPCPRPHAHPLGGFHVVFHAEGAHEAERITVCPPCRLREQAVARVVLALVRGLEAA
jgi:hypothetical protein